MTIDADIHDEIDSRVVETPTGNFLELIADFDDTVSTGNPWPGGSFEWNTNCWLADVDFTGLGWWQYGEGGGGAGYWSAAALLSPRHALYAAHTYPPLGKMPIGHTVRFILGNGTVYEAEVEDAVNVGINDIAICYFTADVPNDIKHYAVFGSNFNGYLTYDETDLEGTTVYTSESTPAGSPVTPHGLMGKPALFVDREAKAKVGRMSGFNDGYGSPNNMMVVICDTKHPFRASYFEAQIVGDSGCPYFLLLDDELVFLGHTYNVATHRAVYQSFVISAINAAMLTLDTDSTGYQLTIADTSGGGGYSEDILASTIGGNLSFLTVYPRDDGTFTSSDMMQSLGLYRESGVSDITPMPVGVGFRFENNKPHFAPVRNKSLKMDDNKPHFLPVKNKPHFRMKNNKPHFLSIGARNG